MALQQTQGGLATARLRQENPMDEGQEADISQEDFVTYYTLPGEKIVSRSWEVLHRPEEIVATQRSVYRTLKYAWRVVDGDYELHEASVQQPGREANVTTVRFQPALPDMRRHFEGVVESRFGVAINGQPGLAMGRVQSFWQGDKAVVRIIPEAPWWVADRPMESHLKYSDEGVQIDIQRIELP